MDKAMQSSLDVSEVDSTPLDPNVALFDVMRELTPVAANWKNIGIALQLRPSKLNTIETANHHDPTACLTSMVTDWLNMNYDVERFGEPTWRWLIQAVGDPAGGDNMALARKIAKSHKVGTKKDESMPNLLDKSRSSTYKTDSGETSKSHKVKSGTGTVESSKSDEAARGITKTDSGEISKSDKAAIGTIETDSGEISQSHKAESGTTETETGKTSRKRKAASGTEVPAVKKTKVEESQPSNYTVPLHTPDSKSPITNTKQEPCSSNTTATDTSEDIPWWWAAIGFAGAAVTATVTHALMSDTTGARKNEEFEKKEK